MSAREGAAPGQAARVVDVSDLARKIQDTWDSEFSRATDTALDYRMARTAVEVTLAAAAAAQPAPGDELAMLRADIADYEALLAKWPKCPAGCSCRIGIDTDPDANECGCDGPCNGGGQPAPGTEPGEALQRTYRQAAEAERDRLRDGIKHEIEQLEQSAAATMPSKKSAIEAGLAERLATWLEGP